MRVRLVDIKVPPDYPRPDMTTIQVLAADIQRNGLAEPIKVRRNGQGYVLIDGRRRLVAVHRLGLHDIPVEVVQLSQEERLAIANAVRKERKARRLAQVKDLFERGYTDEGIATQLDCPVGTIRHDLSELGLLANRLEIREQRRREVLRLHEQEGLGPTEIAQRLGAHTSTINLDFRALGLVGRSPNITLYSKRKAAEKAERQERLRELIAQGITKRMDLAEELRVAPTTISHDLKDMGIKLPRTPQQPGARRDENMTRDAVRLWEDGFAVQDIAAQTGMSESTVYDHLAAAGVREKGAKRVESGRPSIPKLLDNLVNLLQGVHVFDQYDLHGFRFDPEAARAWEKEISQAVTTLNRVRRHLKGST